jgi:serine/threonine-protein kinase
MVRPSKGSNAKTAKLETDEVEIDPSMSMSSMEMSLDEELGRTIRNRYELTRLIGEGGMGVVYAAYDTQVDRDVAIKLVRAECMADKKFMTRFRRELEVTAQLRHPSTIRVFEHGETEDRRPYMVMELLTGISMADRMEQGDIGEIEGLQYARQIAESLSEAHENGIFHRDLKPDNIMIETVGVSTVVKVLDFGIAGGLDATRLTRAGEVFGTPQYMSPEQCNGQKLDHRTDIYSLGCILYEMLEGRPPFSAESPMATMLKHVKSKVPPPRKASRDTVKVLMAALRKDRNKRIQDCGRFAELLGQAIGSVRASKEGRNDAPGVQLPSRRVSTGPIAPVTLAATGSVAAQAADENRNKMIIGGLGAALLLLLGGVMFYEPGGSDDDEVTAEAKEGEKDDAEKVEAEVIYNRAVIGANSPGAKVLVDGEEKCTAPCSPRVPVGDDKTHEIRLTRDGYIDVMVNWDPKTVTEDAPPFPDMKKLGGTIEVGDG